jgi:hypothetical protein
VLRDYSGNAKSTTLVGTISATATSILLADAVGYPTGTTGPFVITVDAGAAAEEKVLCASRTGNTITVATGGRGWDGTTASDHDNGASIRHTYSATDAREANAHVNQTTGTPHGGAYLTPADANAAYSTAAVKAETDPEESTISTAYDGLTTAHEVTVKTGPTGKLLLHYAAAIRGSAAGVVGFTAPLIIRTSDGATLLAPDDARAIYLEGTSAQRQGGTYLFEGAANTQYRIVMRYRTSAGTAFFARRSLTVHRST